MSQVADLEIAILAFLKAAGHEAGGPLGYDFQTLEPYPQDWEARLVTRPLNCPAAFVTFAGFTPAASFGSSTSVTAAFGVAVVAKNLRDKAAARQNGPTANEVGSLTLQEDVSGLVMGRDLGLPIGGLELTNGEFANLSDTMVAAGYSIFALRFTTKMTISATPFTPSAEFIDDFLSAYGAIGERDTLNLFSQEEA